MTNERSYMKNLNEQLTRRKFLKEATQAGATVAVSVGMASAAAPLLARAGEAGPPRAPGFPISSTARSMSMSSASRKGSR